MVGFAVIGRGLLNYEETTERIATEDNGHVLEEYYRRVLGDAYGKHMD